MAYGRIAAYTGRTGARLGALRIRDRAGAGSAGDRIVSAAALMTAWVALLWALEVVDTATGHRLDSLGIQPRRAGELADVVPSAFVHFGYGHLASNTLPLFVLGFIAALRGIGRFLAVSFAVVVVDGLGVWACSPAHTNTAGASGLVFGLFSYLLVRGFVDGRALDLVVGLLVGAYYGTSILWGVLPVHTGVSWQGHLFGLVGGVAAAYLFRDRPPEVRAGRPPFAG
ncbi:hypothetical protein RVR_6002 [Actinacidiphila reveromycinica]|uniref:Peptidase S54 rhomboid domain-containing protein n=2 Tax=Actinacidiphila reveromycinica TaxID=659352 RepID=A0A7U3VQ67_9ACTN|nr:hypothetical protein RVR_6002 [Streptomyces sp. SN-593]